MEHATDEVELRNGEHVAAFVISKPLDAPRIATICCHADATFPEEKSIPVSPVGDKSRLPLTLRLWRYFRKLIRTRHESVALKQAARDFSKAVGQANRVTELALKDCEARIAENNRSTAKQLAEMQKRLDNRDREIDELKQAAVVAKDNHKSALDGKDREIKSYVDLQIPKLQRELQVSESHIEHLEKVLEKKLSYEEMQIAVNNRRLIDAEDVDVREENSMARIMRGDR